MDFLLFLKGLDLPGAAGFVCALLMLIFLSYRIGHGEGYEKRDNEALDEALARARANAEACGYVRQTYLQDAAYAPKSPDSQTSVAQ